MALAVFFILAAPFVGSFLALLAFRLPAHEDVVFARSRCRSCGATLAITDLLPIVSFILNRGRCRMCGAPIPLAYLLIEVGALIVAISAALISGGFWFVVSCLLGWALLTLVATDMRVMVLPNVITLPLIVIGIAVSLLLPEHQLIAHVIGAIVGGAVLWLAAILYERTRGRAGLGMGDVKLFAAAGAWLGWIALPYVMLLACALGLVAILLLRLLGHQIGHHTPLPFGAALAIAFYACWLNLVVSLPEHSVTVALL